MDGMGRGKGRGGKRRGEETPSLQISGHATAGVRSGQWSSQRGFGGFKPPSIEQGMDFLLLKLNKTMVNNYKKAVLSQR